jgi:hypothetical protein
MAYPSLRGRQPEANQKEMDCFVVPPRNDDIIE